MGNAIVVAEDGGPGVEVGPVIGVSIDRPAPVELDHSLTRELTNCEPFYDFLRALRVKTHFP